MGDSPPPRSPSEGRRPRKAWSLVPSVGLVTGANASVALLGFVCNVLLARSLDRASFTAISLFLVAFQFLQEGMGRSLNWAMLRLSPTVDAERPGGGAAMVLATRSVVRRFVLLGPFVVLIAALLLRPWLDSPGAPSRVVMLALAGLGAAIAVAFQFRLGLLQLRERFAAYGAWMVGQSGLRLLVWMTLWAAGALDLVTALAGHLGGTALLTLALGRATRGFVPASPGGSTQPDDRRRVLRFGGRLVLASTLAAVAAQIDLFLLDARADDATTARLRVAALMALAIEMTTNAVMIALLPQAGRAADRVSQRRSLHHGLVLGGLVTIGALLSLPVVELGLPVLFGARYADATRLYPILLAGVVLTALTDPLGLVFVSRDRPGRYVLLNSIMLLVVVAGNLLVPGDDRAFVAAWVRAAGRAVLAAGILGFLAADAWSDRRAAAPPAVRPIDEPGVP